MLGFDLDIWDYLTFLVLTIAGLGVLVALVWLAGLPGRIAIARNHPLMGSDHLVLVPVGRSPMGPRSYIAPKA